MKKFLLITTMLVLPQAAFAGFALKDSAGQTMVIKSPDARAGAAPALSRSNKRPALEVINERYIPDELKKKYSMGDDYYTMTRAPTAPVIEKNAAPVELAAIPDAPKKKRLEIISGKPPVAIAPAPQPQPQPQAEVAAAPVPVAPPEPAVERAPPKELIVESAVPPVPVPAERITSYRARKGENLKDILKRWSEREGTDFVWTAAESPKVSKDFSYVGNFEDAVTKIMAQDSGTLKMKFSDDLDLPGQAPPPTSAEIAAAPAAEPVSIQPILPPIPEHAPYSGPEADDMRVPEAVVNAQPATASGKTWFAADGGSLKDALQRWAEAEGASLIWQADSQYPVKKTVNGKGAFEDAVADVLTQYDDQKVRPVGQLYKNPISGEKVLVIKTDRAG